MKQIFIKKINDDYYADAISSSEDLRMETIAEWLTDDVGGWVDHWKQWINNQERDTASSNASWLIKDSGKIIIASHYPGRGLKDYYDMPNKYTVLISPDNLIEILDTWEMMLQLRPDKIVITEENGVYKMFATN